MDKDTVLQKLSEAIENSTKRNFKQSIELAMNFKGLNMEVAENKLNLNLILPKGRGKDVEVGVFADGDMNVRAKKHAKYVLSKAEIEEYAKSKRKMRVLASKCYAFIASPELMSVIGKTWGVVLGPRSKMPQPVPPNADLGPVIKRVKDTIRLKSKKNPTVHAPVGTLDMKPEDIAENIIYVYESVIRQIPKDEIDSIYIKSTMGKPVRIE
jgi:large subunit ribosomal protein L1